VVVEDIDGDVERGLLQHFLNLTERENLYFLDLEHTLIFQPENADVGWHFINISVTDNNDSIPKFISQHIKIQVQNINDPPVVSIIKPRDGMEYKEDDILSFDCNANDIDFLIPEAYEFLTYRWLTNNSDYKELGNGKALTNVTLPPGLYNITVEVRDSNNAIAEDYIHISVVELPEVKPKSLMTSVESWFWLLLIIIIIIIICIITFFIARKKKRREAVIQQQLPQQVLLPDAAYRSQSATTLLTAPGTIAPTTTQLAQPQTTQQAQIAAPTFQTTSPEVQLPPVHLQPIGQESPGPEIEGVPTAGVATQEPTLSLQQRLVLLDERLLRGEIDQELYESLKAKYEMDSVQYAPVPQLPPANIPQTTATTPTPIPTITPPAPPSPVPAQPQPPMQPTTEMPPEMDVPPPDIISEPVLEPEPSQIMSPPDLPPGSYQQTSQQPTTTTPTQQPTITPTTPAPQSQGQTQPIQQPTPQPQIQPSPQSQPQQPTPKIQPPKKDDDVN
jgi:hypothetical protein